MMMMVKATMGLLRARWSEEHGVGLVLVILMVLALSIMTTTALAMAQATQQQSRADQDRQAALAAAEAGIDDYLYRLSRDDNYWQYRAANDTANPGPVDPSNPAMADFSGTNPEAGWARVPGSDNEARYHYDPIGQTIGQDGSVVLQSTGRVRDQTRTVEVTVRKQTVLEFLYFTEYETVDPVNRTGLLTFSSNPGDIYSPFPCGSSWCTSDAGTQLWTQDNCTRHYYEGRDQGRCTIISFGSNDVIRGPFHTNDAFYVNGSPSWTDRATTSWRDPGERYWLQTPGGVGSPSFPPGFPAYGDPLRLPRSNAEIQIEADAERGSQGCRYTGPTEITFRANGTMDVSSPYSDPGDPGLNSGCLGAGVPIPANGVIYVRGAPATRCDISQPPGGRNPLGYPTAGDITGYGCTSADVFVSGTYQGQITVAAENNIVITGDLLARDRTGTDLLGLVANNFVEVYHPVACPIASCTSSQYLNIQDTPALLQADRTIDAAILALQHTFRVQHYEKGPRKGTLNINGAIAQNFRGPVATATLGGSVIVSGYGKNYVYDPRLAYLSPPHFIEPIDAPWLVRAYAEVQARY